MTIKDIKEKVLKNKKIVGITSVCLVSVIVTTSIFVVKANTTNIVEDTKKEDNSVVSEIKNEEETKTEEKQEQKVEDKKEEPKQETSPQSQENNTPQQSQQVTTSKNNTQSSQPVRQPQANVQQQTKPNTPVTPPTPPVVQKPTTPAQPQTPQYKTYTKAEMKALLNQMKAYGESIGLTYTPGSTTTLGEKLDLVGDKIGESHPLFNKNNTSWGQPISTDRGYKYDCKNDLYQRIDRLKQQGFKRFGFLLEKGGQDDEYKNAEGHWTVIVTYAYGR